MAFRHQINLLKYLTQSQAYLKEGIFRVCGRAQVIQKAEIELQKDKMGTKDITKMFDEIGTYACADLFKSILRKRVKPLINEVCLAGINTAKNLQCENSSKMPHTPGEQVALFLNSTIVSSLSRNDDQLARSLFDFLRLVILHEEDSKMGIHNVSRIFSMLLFDAPITNDPLVFVKETEKSTELLEFMLASYVENRDMFGNQSGVIEPFEALCTIDQSPVCILRGETVHYFYSTKEYAYLQTSIHVVRVDLNTLHLSFKSEKGFSLMPRSRRFKKKNNSDPIHMGEGRRRLSSVSVPQGMSAPFARRKSTIHDLFAFVRNGSVDYSA